MHRGDLTEYEGHSRDGLPFFQQAQQLAAEYARLKPENSARIALHRSSTLLAVSLKENNRFDEALAVLRDAEPIIDSLLAAEPQNPRYLRQKMTSANYESEVYDNESGNGLGTPGEAVAADAVTWRWLNVWWTPIRIMRRPGSVWRSRITS